MQKKKFVSQKAKVTENRLQPHVIQAFTLFSTNLTKCFVCIECGPTFQNYICKKSSFSLSRITILMPYSISEDKLECFSPLDSYTEHS